MNPQHDRERMYVATALVMPEILTAHRVLPEDLETAEYAAVLTAITSMHLRGARVTPNGVRAELEQSGEHALATGRLLSQLTECDPDIEPIATMLRDAAKRRRLASMAHRAMGAIEADKLDVARLEVGKLLLAFADADPDARVMNLRDLLVHTATVLGQAEGQKGGMIRAGLPHLDRSYKLTAGSLLTVGAQTNVGKSSYLLSLLFSMAERGVPVGLISVEDPTEDWGVKVIGSLSGTNPARIWSGDMGRNEINRAVMQAAAKADHPVFYGYVPDCGLDGVLSRMEYMARNCGVAVIAVDYLQAITHRPGKDIRQRIDDTLAELISMAGRLGVSLILASQLSRPDKGNPFREPQLIDLKESGSIENRSQAVVLLWRESDKLGAAIEGKVAKVKRAPAGDRFTLERDPQTAMLREMTRRQP